MLTNLICTVTIPTDYSFKHCGLWCKQIHKYYRSVLVFFSFSSTSNLCILLARSKVVNLASVSGHASGAWEAEPSTFEIDPGSSGRVSPVNKWASWGLRRASFLAHLWPMFFLFVYWNLCDLSRFSFSSRDLFDQPDQDMPHAINVTPAEQQAIERVSYLRLYTSQYRAKIINLFTIFSLLRAFVAGSNGVW